MSELEPGRSFSDSTRHRAPLRRGSAVPEKLERLAREPVENVASSVDYVEVRDADTLAFLDKDAGSRAVVAVACRIGSTRLIDNVVLGEDPPPLEPGPSAEVPS